MSHGINIQIVAGRARAPHKRTIHQKALTTFRIEKFDFAILVWETEIDLDEDDYVFVQGRVQTRSYQKEGQTRYVTEIIAHRVLNLTAGQAGNVVFAIGNLGKAPSMRYTPAGKAVTNVSLAANAFGAERPEWFNLTAWEKVAEVANEYLDKGDRIAVSGRLTRETWRGTGQYEGKTFERTKLTVNDLLMLGSARRSGAGNDDNVSPEMSREELEPIPF